MEEPVRMDAETLTETQAEDLQRTFTLYLSVGGTFTWKEYNCMSTLVRSILVQSSVGVRKHKLHELLDQMAGIIAEYEPSEREAAAADWATELMSRELGE